MEERQRELATNRLLDIIRKGGGTQQPPDEEESGHPDQEQEREIAPVDDAVPRKEPETEREIETGFPMNEESVVEPDSETGDPEPVIPVDQVPDSSEPAVGEIDEKSSDDIIIPMDDVPDDVAISPQEEEEDQAEKPPQEIRKVKTADDFDADEDLPLSFQPLPQRIISSISGAFKSKKKTAKPDLEEVESVKSKKKAAKKLAKELKEQDEPESEKSEKPKKANLKEIFSKKGKKARDEIDDTPVEDGIEKEEKPQKIKARGKRIVILDIGTSSVKKVELLKRGEEYALADFEVRGIPHSMRKNQQNLRILLVKTVRELLPFKLMQKAELFLLLPDQAIMLKNIDLPETAPKERLNAIKFQIKRDIPFPIESCGVNYRGWDPKVKGRQEVEILAVDRQAMDSQIDILEEIGLIPSFVTSSPSSARFLVNNYKDVDAEKGAVAVVDIGASKTTITLLNNDKLVLCRTIATGGDDFTEVLQGLGLGEDGEDLTEAEAEKYKEEKGFPAEGDPSTMRIAILMRPVAERISAEIARSIDLYRRNTGGGELQKVILIGGGAKMERLPQFLSHNLGIDVIVGDPLERIGTDIIFPEEKNEILPLNGSKLMPALAVGLDSTREQNILPAHLKTAVKFRDARRLVPLATVALMVAMTALYSMATIQFNQLQRRMEVIKGQVTSLASNRTEFLVAKAEHDQLLSNLNERRKDFHDLKIKVPDIPPYLKAFSNLVPQNIYFETFKTRFFHPSTEELAAQEQLQMKLEEMDSVLTYDQIVSGLLFDDEKIKNWNASKRDIYGKVIEISGKVYQAGALTEVQLVDFLYRLENSGWFRSVAVDSVATMEDGKVQFVIICGL